MNSRDGSGGIVWYLLISYLEGKNNKNNDAASSSSRASRLSGVFLFRVFETVTAPRTAGRASKSNPRGVVVERSTHQRGLHCSTHAGASFFSAP